MLIPYRMQDSLYTVDMQIDGDPNHVVFYLNPSGAKGAGK
jgi:hypothetical protein